MFNRHPTREALSYHVQYRHTASGLAEGKKTEDQLAAFLTKDGHLFDRDRSNSVAVNRCVGNDTAAPPTTSRVRFPDFRLLSFQEMGVLLLLENDEGAHHDRTACDLARMIEVNTSLRKGGSVGDEGHIVWIRFNPHMFYVNNDMYNPSIGERFKKLNEVLDDIKNGKLALHPSKISIIYLFYDRITVDEDETLAAYEKLPTIFDKEVNSPINHAFIDMLKDFVIKVI